MGTTEHREVVFGVCMDCGSEQPHVLQALAARDELVDVLREDVANLEAELRGKRAQNRRLRAEQDAAMKDSPFHRDALEALRYWKKQCHPKARELGGKRLENAMARLKGGYRLDDLKAAVDGYALKPFVVNGKRAAVGTHDERYDDAELIFRDAGKVDMGMRIAEHADVLRRVMVEAPPSVAPDNETKEGEPVALGDLGETAAKFAAFGWHVFPCRPGQKIPATKNGLLDARNDVQLIRQFWASNPAMNVGIRTGRESGIVVLDIDGEDGWESLHKLEDEHGEMPTTASVTTPSGGQHFYFQHPGIELRNTTNWPAPSIDFRGDGGYVLAPGCLHPNGGKYEVDESAAPAPMPQWLLTLMVQRQEESKKGRTDDEWARFIATGAGEGSRNAKMASFVGRTLHTEAGNVDSTRAMAHAWNEARLKPPLSAKEVDQTVDSIMRKSERERQSEGRLL